tara:strand:+ start:7508 stop:7780 length:273 start_codon:yes stop_codon:yes gene_type:complete
MRKLQPKVKNNKIAYRYNQNKENIMLDLNVIKAWLLARWAERTSWDGVALIVLGTLALMSHALVSVAAVGAIVYGAWTLYTKEQAKKSKK